MGRLFFLLMVCGLAVPAGGRAEEPATAPALAQPLPPVVSVEEAPGSQPVRPVLPAPAPEVMASPPPVMINPPVPAAPVTTPVVPAPVSGPSSSHALQSPALWLVAGGGLAAAMLALGALLAGWVGAMTARRVQLQDEARRREATRTMLAAELDARRQAFEAVPVPPNAEAGVSFVSAVVALSEMDGAWKAAQTSLHLLGEKQAGHLSVHYGAVRYVANFVKGQSFAASLRMLQANRIGGHPCPDPATMREAHVELAAAFRGVDKIIAGLRF